MIITKKKIILVLGKDSVQRINGTTIYAEKSCKISFAEKKIKKLFKLAL